MKNKHISFVACKYLRHFSKMICRKEQQPVLTYWSQTLTSNKLQPQVLLDEFARYVNLLYAKTKIT